MHIFDPASGRNLSLADDDGGAVSVQAAQDRTGTDRTDAGEPQAAAPDAAGSGDVQAAPGQASAPGEAT